MLKGVSYIVVAILLLLITISIVGFVFVFLTRSVESSSETGSAQLNKTTGQIGTNFAIENANQNQLHVRNLGANDLTNLKFYVNGVEIEATVPTIAPGATGVVTLNDSQLSMIPGSGPAEIRVTSGGISDKISKDLYGSNVVAHWSFDEGASNVTTDSSGNNNRGEFNNANPNDGLIYGDTVLLMDFDDGAATDRSAYGNDGMINGAIPTTGISGSALSFDGSSAYVEIASFNNLPAGSADRTVMAWVYIDDYDNYNSILRYGNEVSTRQMFSFVTQQTTGKIGIALFADDHYSNNPVPTGQWVHVAATLEGTTITLYVNGAPDGTGTAAGAIDTQSSAVRIGTDLAGSAVSFFDGTIDEVSLYDRALTPQEIFAHYSARKAQFAEKWVTGKYGSALAFDGLDDGIEIPYSSSLDISNSLTISAWVKMDTSGNRFIFEKTIGGGVNTQYSLFFESGFLRLRLTGASCGDTTSISQPSTGSWHHVAGVYNKGTGQTSLYINGILDNTGTLSSCSLTSGNGVSYIGHHGTPFIPPPAGYFFDGAIDEVRIYDRALNGSEINESMNSAYPVSGAVASYNFNEGSGNVTKDSHIWVKGVSGSALSFDGVDDFVDVGSLPIDWTNSDWTVDVWASLDSDTTDNYRGIIGNRFGVGAGNWWTLGTPNLDGISFERTAGVLINTDFAPKGEGLTHYTVTKEGTIISTYINGVFNVNGDIGATVIGSTTNEVRMGLWAGGSQIWNGIIDEVRIMNIARPMG